MKCTIKPMKSPLRLTAAATVQIQSDFGGKPAFQLDEQSSNRPLAFEIFYAGFLGRMTLVRIISSQIEVGVPALRGVAASSPVFRLVVKDNFGNRLRYPSSPPGRQLTPLFEKTPLSEGRHEDHEAGNDKNFTNWEGSDQKMIDDDLDLLPAIRHLPRCPHPLTLDLRVTAKVSRIKTFSRKFSDSYYSAQGNPRQFDVYVEGDPRLRKAATGANGRRSWKREIIKPSGNGSTVTVMTTSAQAKNGHEFTFDLSRRNRYDGYHASLSALPGKHHVYPSGGNRRIRRTK